MDDGSNEVIETQPSTTVTSINANNVILEYGDIIEIIAPSNQDIHEMHAFIEYIDDEKMKIINISTGRFYQLNITEEGVFTDESITQINLHSKNEIKGYARQNNLLPRTWIRIHFGGDFEAIITGEITNLDEDKIEITTYPELKTIFLNFDYNGIPDNLPIKSIVIIDKPTILKDVASLSTVKSQIGDVDDDNDDEFIDTNDSTDSPSIQFTDSGESITTIPEDAEIDPNIRDGLHDLYINANDIVFGERLDPIRNLVEIPESERRYGIDAQVNDLMDCQLNHLYQ